MAVVKGPRATDLEDSELVTRAREGDKEAFDALFLRHSRYVAGTLYRVIGDDLELDDIVQDTFIVALGRLDDLREGSHFRPWITTIAVRMAKKRLTKRSRRRLFRLDIGRQAPAISDPRERAPADDLYEALDTLPPNLRIPWTLHRVCGETLATTAEACDVSLATVKRRIAEAQRRLEAHDVAR